MKIRSNEQIYKYTYIQINKYTNIQMKSLWQRKTNSSN